MDVLEHNKECLVQHNLCDSLEKTLVGQDASSLIDGNQSFAVAQMHLASPIYSSEKELVKKGNFISGKVKDLALVEEDLWEEEVPIGEWTTAGGKKTIKANSKTERRLGRRLSWFLLSPQRKALSLKGTRISRQICPLVYLVGMGM